MGIKLIMATDVKGGLGKDNDLLFKIPQDMDWFKMWTWRSPVVMGRKTHESIGRLLPDRTNIILTRDPDYKVSGAIMVNDIAPVLNAAAEGNDIMVIGGEVVYELFEPHAEAIYHTSIEADGDADCHFHINKERWVETYSHRPEVDPKHPKIELQIWKLKCNS